MQAGNLTYGMLSDLLINFRRACPPAPRILAVEPLPILAPKRTHRKNRIAKKWLKKYGQKVIGYDRYLGDNLVVIDNQAGFSGQPVMLGHPDIVRLVIDNQAGFSGQPVMLGHPDIVRRLEFEHWRNGETVRFHT